MIQRTSENALGQSKYALPFYDMIGETLMIGDDIEVAVLAVNGNQVSIGVAAPQEVPIHREEMYQRIREKLEPA